MMKYRFFGEFNYKIDDKNRIRIPCGLKKVLDESDTLFLCRSSLAALCIVSGSKIEQISARLAIEPDREKKLSSFFGGISELIEDNQGRFTVPDELMESGNLKKDIVFVGAGDKIEIWDAEKRKEFVGKTPIDLV